jgi:hypothetical protein
MAAGPSKPGDADASAENSGIDAITGGFGDSDDLMPGNDRQLGIGQFAIDQVEIRAADGASLDTNADFARIRCRQRPFFRHQRLSDGAQHHGFHWLYIKHGCEYFSCSRIFYGTDKDGSVLQYKPAELLEARHVRLAVLQISPVSIGRSSE